MTNKIQTPPDSEGLEREEGRKRIEQEDNLVNHRFSWLVGSQAFLLTAFVMLRNDPKFFVTGTVDKPLEKHYEVFLERVDLLIYLVAGVGLLIALSSFAGVLAAFMAISAWRKKVKQEEQQYLTSDALWNFLGGIASFLPGPVLASVWLVLLTAEWPLRVTSFQFWTPIALGGVTLACWIWYTCSMFGVSPSRRG